MQLTELWSSHCGIQADGRTGAGSGRILGAFVVPGDESLMKVPAPTMRDQGKHWKKSKQCAASFRRSPPSRALTPLLPRHRHSKLPCLAGLPYADCSAPRSSAPARLRPFVLAPVMYICNFSARARLPRGPRRFLASSHAALYEHQQQGLVELPSTEMIFSPANVLSSSLTVTGLSTRGCVRLNAGSAVPRSSFHVQPIAGSTGVRRTMATEYQTMSS